MFIKRSVEAYIHEVIRYYPVLLLIGPRQSGKTTLLKHLFADYKYISLEDPDTRSLALNDTRGFLEYYKNKVIFDEAQRVPEIFSYLQAIVDKDRTPGRFILSGSQNFILHSSINQTLAGRVGIINLLPFDFEELKTTEFWNKDAQKQIFNGFYPGRTVDHIPAPLFYSNYISTYIERDVKDLINISNIKVFRQFLKVCAYYSGSILNYNKMSNDLDLSVNTVRNWISILEKSYIIFTVNRHFSNFGKRILKSPKLYFLDTGILCNLLEIENVEELVISKSFGNVFETFIVSQFYKNYVHSGKKPNFSYFRDSNGNEIDFIENYKNNSFYYEIKSAMSFKPEFVSAMQKILGENDRKYLIYRGDMNITYKTVSILPWNEIDFNLS